MQDIQPKDIWSKLKLFETKVQIAEDAIEAQNDPDADQEEEELAKLTKKKK
jgi:hypothetical protein